MTEDTQDNLNLKADKASIEEKSNISETTAYEEVSNTGESVSDTKDSPLSLLKTFANVALTTAIVLAGIILVMVWILPLVLGARPVTVVSGSMEPTMSAGDVIWVDTSEKGPRVGDIVLFQAEAYTDSLTTHRVVGTNTGSVKPYVTQGDANNVPDAPIVQEQIVGTIKSPLSYVGFKNSETMSIPYVGYAQQHLVKIGVILILIAVLSGVVSKLSKAKGNKDKQEVSDDKNKNME